MMVSRGEAPISAVDVIDMLVAQFNRPPFQSALTPQQWRAVYLSFVLGLRRSDVASALGITPDGVRHHLRTAAKAIGVADVNALRRAVDRAFDVPPEWRGESDDA